MNQRTKIAAALLALVAGLALAACGGGDGEQSDTTSPAAESRAGGEVEAGSSEGAGGEAGTTIVVRDGEPVGGTADLEYNAGDRVRFTVRSDVAGEIHVHGYDLTKDVGAGGSVSFSFPADIEGIFEVELEDTATLLAEITVNP